MANQNGCASAPTRYIIMVCPDMVETMTIMIYTMSSSCGPRARLGKRSLSRKFNWMRINRQKMVLKKRDMAVNTEYHSSLETAIQ